MISILKCAIKMSALLVTFIWWIIHCRKKHIDMSILICVAVWIFTEFLCSFLWLIVFFAKSTEIPRMITDVALSLLYITEKGSLLPVSILLFFTILSIRKRKTRDGLRE